MYLLEFIRIISFLLEFIKSISKSSSKVFQNEVFTHKSPFDFPDVLKNDNDRYVSIVHSKDFDKNSFNIDQYRLILNQNDDCCPNKTLAICCDRNKMIECNSNILGAWFTTWLVRYVPNLVERPQWHIDKGSIHLGDMVLFLKSDTNSVNESYESKDGQIRRIDAEYQNYQYNFKKHPSEKTELYTIERIT